MSRGSGDEATGLPDPLAPARSTTLVGMGAPEEAPPPSLEVPLPPPVDLEGVDRARALHGVVVTDAEGRFRLHVVKGSVVELVVNGFGRRTLENGSRQGYQSDYRGKREDVPAGADDVVIRVKKTAD